MAPLPRPIVSVLGEDVIVEIPGRLTLRASFLSEGLFDERSGGDPEEEDLYEVEVTSERGELLAPITFPRLSPAARPEWSVVDEDPDAPPSALPVERYLRALAWDLAHADPSNWERVCEAARAWDSWTVEDAFHRLPPEWTPEPLLPDVD